MSLTIRPNQRQALDVKTQLTLLAMPTNKRVRLLKDLGRLQRQKARARIRAQQDIDGNQFTPRASGRRTKMLRRLGKTLEPYVIGAERLELKHQSRFTGQIAALQQQGGSQPQTAAKVRSRLGNPDYSAPATRQQAKALLAEGYRVPKAKGKGSRRPTQAEVVQRLNHGQAGLLLKQLRGQTPKSRWQVEVPARPFLGDSVANVQRQLADIINKHRG